MSTQEAANGFVSGELLLRSDENDDRCLPPALEKRLRDSLRGRVARKRCGRSLRRAAILREAAAERRGAAEVGERDDAVGAHDFGMLASVGLRIVVDRWSRVDHAALPYV